MKLGVFGLGNMGAAIVRGALAAEAVRGEALWLFDPWPDAGSDLPGVRVSEPADVIAEADILLLATKPDGIVPLLRVLGEGGALAGKTIVSVAAGLRIDSMRAAFGDEAPLIVRAMPNIASSVRAGVTAWKSDRAPSDVERRQIETLLGAIGAVIELPKEELFHAFTGAVGSGISYLFLAAEAIADGAVAEGLPRPLAQAAATAAIFGAGSLLRSSDESPAVWKDRVCSPGGTTIEGIAALERAGARDAFIGAVRAASARSRALADLSK